MSDEWTDVLRKEYECFLGKLVEDCEFENKVNELNSAKQQMTKIKSILLSFSFHTSGFPVLYEDIINNIKQAYPEDNCYHDFIKNVISTHTELKNAYFNCKQSMDTINEEIQYWDNHFNQADADIASRNEAYKFYRHYEDKMTKLVKDRNDKLKRKAKETSAEIEKFDRNKKKYIESTNYYIEAGNKAYINIENILNDKFPIISQSIVSFINFEKKFFDTASKILAYYNDSQGKLDNYKQNFKKKPIEYDAIKFVRGKGINGVISTNMKCTSNGVVGGNNSPIKPYNGLTNQQPRGVNNGINQPLPQYNFNNNQPNQYYNNQMRQKKPNQNDQKQVQMNTSNANQYQQQQFQMNTSNANPYQQQQPQRQNQFPQKDPNQYQQQQFQMNTSNANPYHQQQPQRQNQFPQKDPNQYQQQQFQMNTSNASQHLKYIHQRKNSLPQQEPSQHRQQQFQMNQMNNQGNQGANNQDDSGIHNSKPFKK